MYYPSAIHLCVSELESTERVLTSSMANHSGTMHHMSTSYDENLHAAISNAVFH